MSENYFQCSVIVEIRKETKHLQNMNKSIDKSNHEKSKWFSLLP